PTEPMECQGTRLRRLRFSASCEAAERLVVDEFGDGGLYTANGTVGIATHSDAGERRSQQVNQLQCARQTGSGTSEAPNNQAQRFGGHEAADHAGQSTQHAGLGASGDGSWRGRGGEEAAIAWVG